MQKCLDFFKSTTFNIIWFSVYKTYCKYLLCIFNLLILLHKQNNYALDNKRFFSDNLPMEREGRGIQNSLLLLGVLTVVVPSSGLEKDVFAVQEVLSVLL